MKKLRNLLLGVALALPLAAVGASGDMMATDAAKASTMSSIQSGPQSEKCCWVFFMGNWWCIVC